jgi:hypothetical protein
MEFLLILEKCTKMQNLDLVPDCDSKEPNDFVQNV